MTQEENSFNRVMMIAAHPDDAEFGCGGTMAKWAAAGKEITYVLLTSGDKGTHDPNQHPGALASLREEEQRAAAAELGVKQCFFLRYPDLLLENTLELRYRLAGVIRQHKPHILVAIDPWRHYQLHPDHRAAGFGALDALYAARECHVFPDQLVNGIEPWRVSETYLFWTGEIDYVEDVSDHIEQRMRAIMAHASQVRNPERTDKRIRERTAALGSKYGFKCAEGFKRISFG